MRDHERERIAAAMNHLRPDWPVRQLKTLLEHPQLADRPRRDVTVALSWVACEAATANPYRVLEAGPWWKAAGIEGTASNRDNPDKAHRCSVCSLSQDRCRQVWADDHDYEAASFDHKRGSEAMALIVRDLKDRLEPTAGPPPPREVKRDPRVTAAREHLHDTTPATAPDHEAASGGEEDA